MLVGIVDLVVLASNAFIIGEVKNRSVLRACYTHISTLLIKGGGKKTISQQFVNILGSVIVADIVFEVSDIREFIMIRIGYKFSGNTTIGFVVQKLSFRTNDLLFFTDLPAWIELFIRSTVHNFFAKQRLLVEHESWLTVSIYFYTFFVLSAVSLISLANQTVRQALLLFVVVMLMIITKYSTLLEFLVIHVARRTFQIFLQRHALLFCFIINLFFRAIECVLHRQCISNFAINDFGCIVLLVMQKVLFRDYNTYCFLTRWCQRLRTCKEIRNKVKMSMRFMIFNYKIQNNLNEDETVQMKMIAFLFAWLNIKNQNLLDIIYVQIQQQNIMSVGNVVFFPSIDELPLPVFLQLDSPTHSFQIPIYLYFVQNVCKFLKLLRMLHTRVEISMTFIISHVFSNAQSFSY